MANEAKRNEEQLFTQLDTSVPTGYQPRITALKSMAVVAAGAAAMALPAKPAHAGSAAMLGNAKLATDVPAGAMSVTLNVDAGTLNPLLSYGWIVLDAFTAQCEVRKITGISATVVSFATGLMDSHSADAIVLWLDSLIVDVRWFGAKGDGITDDGNSFNRALAATPAGVEIEVFPGIYRTSVTVVVTQNKNLPAVRIAQPSTVVLLKSWVI